MQPHQLIRDHTMQFCRIKKYFYWSLNLESVFFIHLTFTFFPIMLYFTLVPGKGKLKNLEEKTHYCNVRSPHVWSVWASALPCAWGRRWAEHLVCDFLKSWSLKYLKILYWRCLKILYRKIISSWFFIFLKYYFIFIFLQCSHKRGV